MGMENATIMRTFWCENLKGKRKLITHMLRRQVVFRRSYVHWKTFLGLNSVNYDIIYFGFQRIFFFFFNGATTPSGAGPPHYRGFTITLRHNTLSRTPLDEWSARRRDLYLTTHNTHKVQTSMPSAGFFFLHKTEFYFPYSLYTVNILSYIPTITFPSVTNLLAYCISLSCFWPSIRHRPPGSLSFHPP
jgi:hypothetical protein